MDTCIAARMVVHGQLIEPVVCLSDLHDVFLLNIVKEMVYTSHELSTKSFSCNLLSECI